MSVPSYLVRTLIKVRENIKNESPVSHKLYRKEQPNGKQWDEIGSHKKLKTVRSGDETADP